MKIGNVNVESDEVNPIMGIELEAFPIIELRKEKSVRKVSGKQAKLVIMLETKAKKEYQEKCKKGYPAGLEWGADAGGVSINGNMPELRFPPATFSKTMDGLENIQLVLDSLKNNYLESDNNQSGMHIHVQRDFVKLEEFYKILDFFEQEQDFIAKFSGRSHERKFNFIYGATPEGDKKLYLTTQHGLSEIEQFKQGTTDCQCIRLNTPCGHPTLEFRIFNGTLDINKFIANIQFVERMVNFVKHDLPLTHKAFVEYIMESGSLYETLMKDLLQRGLLDSDENEKQKEDIKSVLKELEKCQ